MKILKPAAVDARWPISSMDFRSNEADRIARMVAGDCTFFPLVVTTRAWRLELRNGLHQA
jgi:hypothetical protein